MECPKCSGEMDDASEGDVSLQRCRVCYGLYFDKLTRAKLLSIAENTEIDTGSDASGQAYDSMVYVDCPKCDRIMDQRVIERPNRIRFELCLTCNSTFLDAGEFNLYTSEDYLEDFLSLLSEL